MTASMYSKGKYIVGMIDGFETAVCFPETVNHDHFRRVFSSIKSAGFFHVVKCTAEEFARTDKDLKAVCYGNSVSLKVASEPETDATLVGHALALHPTGW